MFSRRENFLEAFAGHKKPPHVPSVSQDLVKVGGPQEFFENGPIGGGYDDFGVKWLASESANGAGSPDGSHIVLDDVTQWEDLVHFPDLDRVDWASEAERQLRNVDRTQKVIEYNMYNGQFLRLTHLMGFVEALCAMLEEEDACKAFFKAVTDYKIKVVERVAEYFKPDIITLYIDVATERGLFMSPEAYREMLSPEHKRLNDVIKSFDIYPSVHNCGKCEIIVPDFIREGYVNWCSAQPMNDIVGILDTYGAQISVTGGYDTNGRPGQTDAAPDEVRQEVRRCVETYAPHGSYIFAGARLVNSADPADRVRAREEIENAFKEFAE